MSNASEAILTMAASLLKNQADVRTLEQRFDVQVSAELALAVLEMLSQIGEVAIQPIDGDQVALCIVGQDGKLWEWRAPSLAGCLVRLYEDETAAPLIQNTVGAFG